MDYRTFIQKIIYRVITPVIKVMLRIGLTPNVITFLGFVGNIAATCLFIQAALEIGAGHESAAYSWIAWGGAVIIFSGLFDMIDGHMARIGNLSSSFGALWDSTLDRYSEMVSLFGIFMVFEKAGWWWTAIITFLALMGSVMVSYVRSRAEGLRIECKVGLMQRPERVVVTALVAIIAGATANLWWLAGGMILIAVLANITALWRLLYCYQVLKKKDAGK